jgi:vanillate O-demethylase monooxygenase subunit
VTPDAATLGNTSPLWRRAWHPVAHAEELAGGGPVQVLVAGEAWAVARLDGVLAAFADRCPHRLAPLSAGQVTRAADGSARLACGYHGWQYDPAGRCDLIPSLGLGRGGEVSKRARLRPAYGVTEAYGLVWLAPAEPLAPLPAFGEWGADGMTCARSQTVCTRASAGHLVDNFLDAAHFPFVHAASFGVADDGPLAAGAVTTAGWQVTGVFDTPYRDGGAVVSHRVIKTAGASPCAHVRLELPDVTIGLLLACQPQDNGLTRVFKLITRSDVGGDAGRLAAFIKEEDQILAEDLAILERYPSGLLPLDPRAEVHTRADRLSVAWRRLIARAALLE